MSDVKVLQNRIMSMLELLERQEIQNKDLLYDLPGLQTNGDMVTL